MAKWPEFPRVEFFDSLDAPGTVRAIVYLDSEGHAVTDGPAWAQELISKPAGVFERVEPTGGLRFLRALEWYSGSRFRAVLRA